MLAARGDFSLDFVTAQNGQGLRLASFQLRSKAFSIIVLNFAGNVSSRTLSAADQVFGDQYFLGVVFHHVGNLTEK